MKNYEDEEAAQSGGIIASVSIKNPAVEQSTAGLSTHESLVSVASVVSHTVMDCGVVVLFFAVTVPIGIATVTFETARPCGLLFMPRFFGTRRAPGTAIGAEAAEDDGDHDNTASTTTSTESLLALALALILVLALALAQTTEPASFAMI